MQVGTHDRSDPVAPKPGSVPRTMSVALSFTLLVVILIALADTGCTTYRKDARPIPEIVAKKPQPTMRLTLAGGERVEVDKVFVLGDTLVGTQTIPGQSTWKATQEVRIPLSQIASTEVLYTDGVATTLLIVAIGATVIIAIAGGSGTPSGSSTGSTDPCENAMMSCPTLASWDGATWRLDSGTFAGGIMPALARTDVDLLQFARAERDIVRVRLQGAGGEVDHVDAVELLAVDHAEGAEVIPDPSGILRALRDPLPARDAKDDRGADARPRVERLDGWGWESSLSPATANVQPAEVRPPAPDWLEIVFQRPGGARYAWLVVEGNNTPWGGHLLHRYVALHGRATQAWMDSVAANSEAARSLGLAIHHASALRVSVAGDSGWISQGEIPGAGPEVVKRQCIRLDLGAVQGDEIRVRLESLPLAWWIDRVSLQVEDAAGVETQTARLTRATARDGTSALATLAGIDHGLVTLQPGETVDLEFAAPPAPPPGRSRSYVAKTTGWYRLEIDESVPPDTARLTAINGDPRGLSRWNESLRRDALTKLAPPPEPAR